MGRFSARVERPRQVITTPRVYDPAITSGLVCSSETSRIVNWRNVVLQSVTVADLSFAQTLGTVLRKQLRAHPRGVVSLAVLHTGLRPAPKNVRTAMARVLEDLPGPVHHMLVVEDLGLIGQLLITMIRGVMLLVGKGAEYTLPSNRQDAIMRTLMLVPGADGSAQLERELGSALAFCCEPH